MLLDGPKMVIGRCIAQVQWIVMANKNSTPASEKTLWAMEHGVRMTQDTQNAYLTVARLKYLRFYDFHHFNHQAYY